MRKKRNGTEFQAGRKQKSHQPRLRMVACEGQNKKSGLSGFLFRVRAGVAHSHGRKNRHVNAQDREENRVGGWNAHIVDCIIAVLQMLQPSHAESNFYGPGQLIDPVRLLTKQPLLYK